MIGLSSPLSVNGIRSTVQGRILNCSSCRKHKQASILGDAWCHGCVIKATPWLIYPQERPGTHCIGDWVYFLGVKWPWHGLQHPPPSSTEVKERVELYLYSPSALRGLFWDDLYLCQMSWTEWIKTFHTLRISGNTVSCHIKSPNNSS